MESLIYGNGSQESERAKMVLESCGQQVKEFLLGVDFSDRQFRAEFGSEAEYPQIAIGLNHRGTLKETLKYMSDNGMFV
tara:strand:+ start:680 stop:916 length:237 start_codon:yes stop_codon:yes gene_type:complete